MFKALVRTRNNVGPLFLRLALATIFFAHGSQKVLGWFGGLGFHGTLDAMHKSGLPHVVVILVMCAEFLGAIGLFLGFLTRIAAAGICADMVGAIYRVHWVNGFFMNWHGVAGRGEGFEFHVLVIGACLALMVLGAGALSLDRGLTPKPRVP